MEQLQGFEPKNLIFNPPDEFQTYYWLNSVTAAVTSPAESQWKVEKKSRVRLRILNDSCWNNDYLL